MIIRNVEKAEFDFINRSGAMALRVLYSGQCAKPSRLFLIRGLPVDKLNFQSQGSTSILGLADRVRIYILPAIKLNIFCGYISTRSFCLDAKRTKKSRRRIPCRRSLLIR